VIAAMVGSLVLGEVPWPLANAQCSSSIYTAVNSDEKPHVSPRVRCLTAWDSMFAVACTWLLRLAAEPGISAAAAA
jgi:hypothetical protein